MVCLSWHTPIGRYICDHPYNVHARFCELQLHANGNFAAFCCTVCVAKANKVTCTPCWSLLEDDPDDVLQGREAGAYFKVRRSVAFCHQDGLEREITML